ncbi:ATP-binding protein [Actinacidiphila alni]|uniref:ATP-binding protein n=1 Tax=Actinacidiphila alni TaxID=380248 RepID=UPI003454B452
MPEAVGEDRPSVVVKTWPHGPRSAGGARRLLVRSLDSWGLAHLADAAGLVVSELVTNSVRHAREPHGRLIGTRFERLQGAVRIEVHDANSDRPEPREADSDAESGRGLFLVNALTGGSWGVSAREGVGKQVWAVVGSDADAASDVPLA